MRVSVVILNQDGNRTKTVAEGIGTRTDLTTRRCGSKSIAPRGGERVATESDFCGFRVPIHRLSGIIGRD